MPTKIGTIAAATGPTGPTGHTGATGASGPSGTPGTGGGGGSSPATVLLAGTTASATNPTPASLHTISVPANSVTRLIWQLGIRLTDAGAAILVYPDCGGSVAFYGTAVYALADGTTVTNGSLALEDTAARLGGASPSSYCEAALTGILINTDPTSVATVNLSITEINGVGTAEAAGSQLVYWIDPIAP